MDDKANYRQVEANLKNAAIEYGLKKFPIYTLSRRMGYSDKAIGHHVHGYTRRYRANEQKRKSGETNRERAFEEFEKRRIAGTL